MRSHIHYMKYQSRPWNYHFYIVKGLLRDQQKLPQLTMFQVIKAGYWVKFSTSNNHVSVELHRLWNCLCASILLPCMSFKWTWTDIHVTRGAVLKVRWCTLLRCGCMPLLGLRRVQVNVLDKFVGFPSSCSRVILFTKPKTISARPHWPCPSTTKI